MIPPTLNHYDNVGLVMEAELEAIGMNVEVSTCDWATFTTLRNDKSAFDLYVTSFASVPIPTLKAFYGAAYPGWTVDDVMTEKISVLNKATSKEDAFLSLIHI